MWRNVFLYLVSILLKQIYVVEMGNKKKQTQKKNQKHNSPKLAFPIQR